MWTYFSGHQHSLSLVSYHYHFSLSWNFSHIDVLVVLQTYHALLPLKWHVPLPQVPLFSSPCTFGSSSDRVLFILPNWAGGILSSRKLSCIVWVGYPSSASCASLYQHLTLLGITFLCMYFLNKWWLSEWLTCHKYIKNWKFRRGRNNVLLGTWKHLRIEERFITKVKFKLVFKYCLKARNWAECQRQSKTNWDH